MTTIKTTCPVCGDIDLTPSQVRLVVATRSTLSYYAFRCTTCQDEVRRHAEPSVVELLVAGGVVPEPWDVPDEAFEPHEGPPLSYDDLLDFALALSRGDQLVAALIPTTGRTRG